MTRLHAAAVVLTALVALTGCLQSEAEPDAGAADAAVDATTADRGAVDALPGPDAAPEPEPDAAPPPEPEPDAAPEPEPDPDADLDRGVPDMAVPDAARAPDMGPPDNDYERDPARLDLRGPCPLAERFGGFKVEANEAEGYTAIDGVVRDSIVAGQVLEEALAGDGCALLRRRRLICEPVCEPGQTCDLDNVCVPAPRGQDMGPVTFHGLVQPLTLEALQPGNSYFFTRLPHPGFEPGVVQHIDNVPGFVGPLDLYGVGVEPLVGRNDVWVLTEGEALVIRWDPPADGTHSRLYFELNIDQHGLSPANLVCSLPDTGEAVVPIAMTDALIAAGVTGYPTGRMARRTVDSARFDGRCVDFTVSSVRPIDEIEVTGYRPCTVHADCPDGPCNLEIQQCE